MHSDALVRLGPAAVFAAGLGMCIATAAVTISIPSGVGRMLGCVVVLLLAFAAGRMERESGTRIRAAADAERRRIERDLHDGAQQRLVALRIELELAADRTADGSGAGAALLRRLGDEVEEALEEIRSLARGLAPAPLADCGLVASLRAAALRTRLPTTVHADGVRRYPRAIESAAYFCCLEALQNAAKHAHGATGVVVELSDDGLLRLEVRDDGAGFDPAATEDGVGFVSMRERVAAVGGEVAISSSPGAGTRVSARIPPASAPLYL